MMERRDEDIGQFVQDAKFTLDGNRHTVKRSDSKGKDGLFTVSPSVVHFGGYTVGKTHSIKVLVTNTSLEKMRVYIQGTKTKVFQTKYDKKGLIPPGMSEVITVRFKADEWKYYQDQIEVRDARSGSEVVVVPVHAYPVMNKAVFPRLFDFGVCALNETHQKVAQLKCKVPVPFDFEIEEIASMPEFKVYPRTGQVPANGSVPIYIEFKPTRLAVVSFSFRLNLSQFNFEPIVCTVTGSSCPGVVRSIELQKHKETFHREVEDHPTLSPRVRNTMKNVTFDTYDQPVTRKVRGIGSGGVFDPGAAVLEEEKKCPTNQEGDESIPTSPKKRRQQKRQIADEIEMNGIKVPIKLEGVQVTNYVLTQEPGKLKPKQLKVAIEKHRAAKAQEKQEQEAAEKRLASRGAKIDPVERIVTDDLAAMDKSITRQVKEMMFLQQVLEIEDEEKSREFSSQAICIGSDLLLDEQVETIKSARDKAQQELEASERRVQRQTWNTELLGPTSVPPVRVQSLLMMGNNDLLLGDMDLPDPAAPPSAPSFDPYVNDLWSMRKGILVRFKQVVGKVIVRNRVKRRIMAIWKRLGKARTRKAVRRLVDEDHMRSKQMVNDKNQTQEQSDEPEWKKYRRELIRKAVVSSNKVKRSPKLSELQDPNSFEQDSDAIHMGDMDLPPAPKEKSADREQGHSDGMMAGPLTRSKIMESVAIGPLDVHLVSFPLYIDSVVFEAKPVESHPCKGFQDLGFFQLQVPDEYKLCGYSKFAYPKVPTYVPKYENMHLRSGAMEESSWAQTGNDVENEELATLLKTKLVIQSSWVEDRHAATLDYIIPSKKVRTFVRADDFTEFDVEFDLRPRLFNYVSPNTRDSVDAWAVGVSSARALSIEPTISDRFRQNQNPFNSTSKALWDVSSILGALLDGPLAEDMLSDDEASDVEQDDGSKDTEGESGDQENKAINIDAAGALFESDDNETDVVEIKQKYSPAEHRNLLDGECTIDRELQLNKLQRELQACREMIKDPRYQFNLNSLR